MTSRARPELLQGDIVKLHRSRTTVVIIGRSCDLPRERPSHVHVAPVVTSDNVDDVRGWNPRRVRIPAESETTFADMSAAHPVDKRQLPNQPARRGCSSNEHAQQFRREVGRFFSMSSLPDGVNNTVNSLWGELRKRRTKMGHDDIIDQIEDIRVRFTPQCPPEDENTPRSMTLIFVIATGYGEYLVDVPPSVPDDFGVAVDAWNHATTLHEKAAAIDGYCRLLGSKCVTHPPVHDDLGIEVVSSGEFTRDEQLNSYPIRVEAMSG